MDSNADAIKEIRVDGTNIYYVRVPRSGASLKSSKIEKVPVGGGAPSTLAADVIEPSMLVLDDAYVYFARYVCAGAVPCGVFRLPKAGGAVQTLAQDPDGGQPLEVSGLAVDDTYAYFGAQLTDSLMRVKKDGSASAEVLSANNPGVRGIQTDAQYIYFVDAAVGNVKFLRLAKSAAPGTTPDVLATLTGGTVGHTPTNVRAVGMTDTEIVWADTGNDVDPNTIVRLPKTPGGATTPILSSLKFVDGIKTFGTDLFYIENGDVKKVPVAGGTPQLLAGYPASAVDLSPVEVDATGVYWITLNDIRRLTF